MAVARAQLPEETRDAKHDYLTLRAPFRLNLRVRRMHSPCPHAPSLDSASTDLACPNGACVLNAANPAIDLVVSGCRVVPAVTGSELVVWMLNCHSNSCKNCEHVCHG